MGFWKIHASWYHFVQIWLVVSTHLKNISQIGKLPQLGVNIKNIWNASWKFRVCFPYFHPMMYNETLHLFHHPVSQRATIATGLFRFEEDIKPPQWHLGICVGIFPHNLRKKHAKKDPTRTVGVWQFTSFVSEHHPLLESLIFPGKSGGTFGDSPIAEVLFHLLPPGPFIPVPYALV